MWWVLHLLVLPSVSLDLRYLYWLSNGQVSRCPLNLLVNCSDKKEQIPTSLGSVNDFVLKTSSLETVLYRVNGTHLSVGDPDRSDAEVVCKCVSRETYVVLCTLGEL